MKKLLIITMAAAVAVLSSCAQPVELKYDFQVGEVYNSTVTSAIDMTMKVQGMEIPMNMEVTVGVSYKVVEDKGSSYILETQYTKMSNKVESLYGNVVFDSDTPDADPASKLYASLTGIPFLMEMSDSGETLDVSNADALVDNVVSQLGDLPQEQRAQMEQLVRETFGGDALKNNVEMVAGMLPHGKVSPGDKWERDMNVNTGIPISAKVVYEYVGDEGDFRILAATADVDTGEEGVDAVVNGMSGKYVIKGYYRYNIKLDKKTSWTKEAKTDFDMDVIARIDQGGMEIEVPMKMTGEVTITDK